MPLDTLVPLAIPVAVILATLFWYWRKRRAFGRAMSLVDDAERRPASAAPQAPPLAASAEAVVRAPRASTAATATATANATADVAGRAEVLHTRTQERLPFSPPPARLDEPEEEETDDGESHDVFVDESAFEAPDAQDEPLESLTEPLPDEAEAASSAVAREVTTLRKEGALVPSASASSAVHATPVPEDTTPVPDATTPLPGALPTPAREPPSARRELPSAPRRELPSAPRRELPSSPRDVPSVRREPPTMPRDPPPMPRDPPPMPRDAGSAPRRELPSSPRDAPAALRDAPSTVRRELPSSPRRELPSSPRRELPSVSREAPPAPRIAAPAGVTPDEAPRDRSPDLPPAPRAALGSTPLEPAPVAPPRAGRAPLKSATSELERSDPRHLAARRFARLAISEIVLYHEAEVQAGRKANDLWTRFKADIDLCFSTYDKRFPKEVREQFDYLYDELVNQLAQGDPNKLGPHAPRPAAPPVSAADRDVF